MEKTFFLKKSYDSVIPHTIVAYVLTIAFVLFKIVRDKELSVVSGLSILFLTAILILVIKHDISTGLYIKGVNMGQKGTYLFCQQIIDNRQKGTYLFCQQIIDNY